MNLASTELEAEVERWLGESRKQIEPRFPPNCENAYLADTAPGRVAALKAAIMVGVVTGIAIIPALWTLMPDAHLAVQWAWCGAGVPLGLASYLLLWTRLSSRLKELQAASCATGVALAFSVLMTSSVSGMPSVYFGGMLLLIMLDVIAAGFRFRVAVAYSLALTVMFAIFVQRIPVVRGLTGHVLTTLMATCSVFAVFGAWRVESEMRRSYALMLREQLRQRALTARNLELDELALRDALTGLANRRAFESWKVSAWAAAEGAGGRLGLLILDVDRSCPNTWCSNGVAEQDCLLDQAASGGRLTARLSPSVVMVSSVM